MTHPLYVQTIDKHDRKFPSIRATARAYRVSRMTVAYHLDTHGDLSRLGMGNRRINPQNAAKQTVLGPHSFPSRVKAAKALGISLSQLNRWTNANASPAMRDMLMAALMAYGVQKS